MRAIHRAPDLLQKVRELQKSLGNHEYLLGFQQGLEQAIRKGEFATIDAFADACCDRDRGQLSGAAGDLDSLVAFGERAASAAPLSLVV